MADEIQKEIQSLSPSAMVELFELDLSAYDTSSMHFHAGTNSLTQPVVWQGQTYLALPIEAEGFEITTQGTLPRPTLRVANVNGIFSAAIREYDDLVGCKITRRRTFVRFLDAANFEKGNSEADPNQHLPDEVWYVEQKTSETKYIIEWELSSAMDLQGVMLPRRQVIQSMCPFKYRGAECGYTAAYYFNKNDEPCQRTDDFCAKRLTSCEVRAAKTDGIVRFGGFPGAVRYNVS